MARGRGEGKGALPPVLSRMTPREARAPRTPQSQLRRGALCKLYRCSSEFERRMAFSLPLMVRVLARIVASCRARRDGVDYAGPEEPGPLWVPDLETCRSNASDANLRHDAPLLTTPAGRCSIGSHEI